MLAQPEFQNMPKLEELMRILENEHLFHEWAGDPDNVQTVISPRNKLIQIGDCSIVTSAFDAGKDEQGQLMVIGPNRMPYSKVIALMDCLSEFIEKRFGPGQKGGGQDE